MKTKITIRFCCNGLAALYYKGDYYLGAARLVDGVWSFNFQCKIYLYGNLYQSYS